MASPDQLHKLHSLGPLALALTLCLTSRSHGLILCEPDPSSISETTSALASLSSTLSLSCASVDCASTHPDAFREQILIAHHLVDDDNTPDGSRRESTVAHHLTAADMRLDERRVADVLLVANLDRAPDEVQVLILELISTGRMYTRAAMHRTGRRFVVLAVVGDDGAKGLVGRGLNRHLRDRFAVAHWHGEEGDGESISSVDTMGSVVRRPGMRQERGWGMGLLSGLRKAMETVVSTAEVSAYLQNVVVAMRLHRYVAGGVTALATRQMREIAKALALLHGLEYVTPAIVALAARKVYLHRLVLADERTERSLRWGSDPAAVRYSMQDVDVEVAIDTAIASVAAPL